MATTYRIQNTHQIEVVAGLNLRFHYTDSMKDAINMAEDMAHTYGSAQINVVEISTAHDPDGEVVSRKYIDSYKD